MNQRDQDLLDKQLWGVSPNPPRHGSILGVAFVGVFLIGIAIGDFMFAHESSRIQNTSHDVIAALSGLNGVPPTRQ
jgi:hypothetical protein